MRGFAIKLGLAAILPLGTGAVSGTGTTTRYWDCCKPSCAWPGKASVNNPVYTCDKNDQPLSDYNTKSGCDSGTAYTCTNQSPWAVNDLVSYGYAATAISGQSESDWCCACYAVTLTSGKAKGKIMLIQSVNTGGDLSDNQFDLQIPGGGEGIFDGCTSEFGGIGGAQYGGISNRSECDAMPAKLQPGCYWRFDWFLNSDNPTHSFTQIQCPTELTSRTGCTRSDDSSYPKYTMPSVTTWNPPTPTETAAAYDQCDSLTWDVAKLCPSGYYCKYVTDYYWQCAQGSDPNASSTTSKSTVVSPPSSSTTQTSSVSTTTQPSSTVGGSQQTKYGQCGGSGWNGPTACIAGSVCSTSNPYYAQCL
ncbi:Carbohydrate-binding module family 1 protein [Pleurostoma richardsiae]|uniref:Cellulase n=1 Tax=Pleurostoma richardsiae TaxID=41990 RepID=A0AA38VPS8_9PEZI|nr:Carbohydrate-binding module family 1 protein [Pleurostoma richardsiae]